MFKDEQHGADGATTCLWVDSSCAYRAEEFEEVPLFDDPLY